MSDIEDFEGKTIDELDLLRLEANERVLDIQAQLSNKSKMVDGMRVGSHEYHDWRGRAVGALRYAIARQGRIKLALKQANTRATARLNRDIPRDLATDRGLLHAALTTLITMAEDGVEIDPEEQELIEAIRARLRNGGLP